MFNIYYKVIFKNVLLKCSFLVKKKKENNNEAITCYISGIYTCMKSYHIGTKTGLFQTSILVYLLRYFNVDLFVPGSTYCTMLIK